MPQYQRMSSLDELLMLLDHQMVRDQIRKISSNAPHPVLEICDDGDAGALSTADAHRVFDNIDDTNITDDFVHVVLLPVKKQRRTGCVDGGLHDKQSKTSIDELLDIIDHNMVKTEENLGDPPLKTCPINPNDPSKSPEYERLSSLDELLSLLDHNMVRDQIRKISNTMTPYQGAVPDMHCTDEEIIARMLLIPGEKIYESGDNAKAKSDDCDEKNILNEASSNTNTPPSEEMKANEDESSERVHVAFDSRTEEHAPVMIQSANADNEGVRQKVTPAISKDKGSFFSSDSKHSAHKRHSFLNDFLSLLKSNILVRERIRKISEQNLGKFPFSDDILQAGCENALKMDPILERHADADILGAKECSTYLINAEREHTKL